MKHSFACSIFCLLLLATPARAESRIVASLKPIHSLIAAITEGVETPALLVDGAASPHGYALKPSQIALLDDAEFIVWIAPELESFLTKPLQTVATHAEILTLVDLPELTLHAFNDHDDHKDQHEHDDGHDDHKDQHGHDDGHDDHKDQHGHDDHHGHHDGNDPHIWLDPDNAAVMIDAISSRLIALYPQHQATYQRNTARLHQRVQQLDTEIRAILTPVQTQPYMVFHDAFRYFSRHYGLRDAGVMSRHPESQLSVTEIHDAQDYVDDHNVTCLFAEPQFPANRIEAIRENNTVRVATLDALGARLNPSPDLYFTLMRTLAQTMRDCLEQA